MIGGRQNPNAGPVSNVDAASTTTDKFGNTTEESGTVTYNKDGSSTWNYSRVKRNRNGKVIGKESWSVSRPGPPAPAPAPAQPASPSATAPVAQASPAASQPQPSVQAEVAKATDTHKKGLAVKGNDFPTGKPIPCQYGLAEAFPDLAAMPYTDIAGETAVLHLLFCLGHGHFEAHSQKLNGVDVASVGGVATEILPPGSRPTLYPTTVIPQDVYHLLSAAPTAAVVVNAADSPVSRIAVEISFVNGLFALNGSGDLQNTQITVVAEAQAVDGAGNPVGNWATLLSQTLDTATQYAFTESFSATVAAGRWQVRVRRATGEAGGTTQDRAILSKVSGYHVNHPDYGAVTMAAVQIVTSRDAQLTELPKFSVLCTRKLPVWNGAAWTSPVASRSVVWALADVLKASYGGLMADSILDLPALAALDALLAARGDWFDVRFTDQLSMQDIIKTVCTAGRLIDFFHQGRFTVVRDQNPAGHVQLFTPLNMVEGSFQVTYKPAQATDEDAYHVEYMDLAKNALQQVTATLGASAKPKTIKLVGCTSRSQAWREGMFWRACKAYRRVYVTFNTGLEGAAVRPGDNILVSHDSLSWGQWGEVYQVGSDSLYLSNPVDFGQAASATMYLRKETGEPSPAFAVTPDINPYVARFAALPAMTVHSVMSDTSEQRTHYAFDNGNATVQDCKVLSVRPAGPVEYQIDAVVDDPRCYAADTGSTPAPPASFALAYSPATVYGGTGGFGNGGAGAAGIGPLRFSDLTVTASPYFAAQYDLKWHGAGYASYVIYAQFAGQAAWSRMGVTPLTGYVLTQANPIPVAAVKVVPTLSGIEQSALAITVSSAAFNANLAGSVTGSASLSMQFAMSVTGAVS